MSRRWYRTPTLIGVWTLSLLVAMPGTGSSVADATLSNAPQSVLVLASVQGSNPASRVMTRLPANAAPMVRMVRLDESALDLDIGGPSAPVMWLHDRVDPPHLAPVSEVDLSRLHALWLSAYAPQASLHPLARPETRLTQADADQAGPSLSTSGVIVVPAALTRGDPAVSAPITSLVPVSRPEGLSKRVVRYSRDWLRQIALRTPSQEEACLATAIYHEARGETLKGQFAVAEVILNRVASRQFPDTICGVVFQGVREGRYGGCQFSFACDSKSDVLRNRSAADLARRIAQVMADGGHRGLTGGALYFHTTAVNPYWSRQFTQTTQIGAHLFYRG